MVLNYSFPGISPPQSLRNYKDDSDVIARRELRKSWNTQYASGVVGDYHRACTPFRAVTNSGDFLNRVNYICGGSQPRDAFKPGIRRLFGSLLSNCDTTGVPASNANIKFVTDSSDYTKYKRQATFNKNYNDMSFGGYNNSAYTDLMRVRS